MKKFIATSLLALSAIATISLSVAEDIELYISDVVRQAGKSTKVLIIFDNSGSMAAVETVSASYDPDIDYLPEGASNAYNDDATYFNVGDADGTSTIPDSPSDARRFLAAINSCETSKELLQKYGFYTGHIREYTYKGQTGLWSEVPSNNGLDIQVLDCEDDAYIVDSAGTIINAGTVVNATGVDVGYPVNGQGTKQNPVYHSENLVDTNVDWSSGSYVTLYTANYLRWYHALNKGTEVKSRMESAQESVTSVINTTPSVDFGLEIFNYNKGDNTSDGNGGRIAIGIRKMTADNKASILDIINEQLTSETWTPLCESLYEANQYFSGGIVDFGDDDIDVGTGPGRYVKNTPPRDTLIEKDGSYTTPFSDCANSVAHVILITDGVPTYDFGANSKILGLRSKRQETDANGDLVFENGNAKMIDVAFTDEVPGFNNDTYTDDGSNSYLPALAGWMSNFDVNPNLAGIQKVQTHTIAFSSAATDAQNLLRETAIRGQGDFIFAANNVALTTALTKILSSIEPGNDTLTSASVAANNFDRTQTLDSVYYAMFDPQISPRWQGNLKKYKAVGGELTGVGNVKAICEDENGIRSFCPTVKSYWSPSVDGDTVSKGGVAAWFSSKEVSDRTVYLENGDGNSLITFNRTNLEVAFTDQAGLATKLGVAGAEDEDGNNIESAEIDKMINWTKGMDVDDDDNDTNITEMRSDVFGDPLHSKPLVVNYGDSIRIVVGTNAGALHMFEDSGDRVKENWAFMPTEFVSNIKVLRDNFSSADKIYGIDGEITLLLNDIGGDGKIDGDDTAWIFFGLRRGGSSYYALDISKPDLAPKLMWKIDSGTAGFGLLGQSWSKPKVGYSKLNISGDVANPVIFIGGGYDTNKDGTGAGTDDSKGIAVYMLDAKTGALKWSMAPSGGNTTFAGTDSIAAGIGLLDSTGNGLTDRLYVGDTGGNVWRVDMPDEIIADFSVFKLASLGGTTNLTDRRFFYESSIVRAFISETIETTITDEDNATKTIRVHQEIPYDAILIGSGDRSNPLGQDTQDSVFMIKDKYTKTQTFSSTTTPATPTTILNGDLYDYTNDPFKDMATMSTQDLETLQRNVSAKSGWFIDLKQSGEKSSASALAINGVAYFTTYTPPALATALVKCKPPAGIGSLLAVDLALGVKKHNTTKNVRSDDQRYIDINNEFLGSPTLIVLPDDPNDPKSDVAGDIIVGDLILPVNFTLRTMRTSLYLTEGN